MNEAKMNESKSNELKITELKISELKMSESKISEVKTSAIRKSEIRVLIVDDSAFMRTALSRMIGLDDELRVVGTAASGAEALQAIPRLDPDVITLDVSMPGLDGLETLRRIMAQFPRPVIMVSSSTLKDADITLSALAVGAFDYVPKELSPSSLDVLHIRGGLISRIKAAVESRRPKEQSNLLKKPPRSELPGRKISREPALLVALGVSTGGPKALEEILPHLPPDLPVPILVVQHMPMGFIAPFAARLNKVCAISVCEAANGEVVLPGVVYMAPAGFHVTVSRVTQSRTIICLSDRPPDQLHIPSIDVMMRSVATMFHAQAMGVIMTGMGSDGAQGMSFIRREGGYTVGQDEASCAVYGMPKACAEMGILDKVVSLSQIPNEILQSTSSRHSSVG
jgi:two-component system, chemotaxis family, protein-glutamate methylesterase/glutaminase